MFKACSLPRSCPCVTCSLGNTPDKLKVLVTTEIALVLAKLDIAIVFFATERIRLDVISMMVLLSLILTGLLTVEEAFSGFSNPAIITVWAIYIVSVGLFIPGSRKLERLDENIGSLAVELNPADLQEMDSALSKIMVQGDRYPKEIAIMSDR